MDRLIRALMDPAALEARQTRHAASAVHGDVPDTPRRQPGRPAGPQADDGRGRSARPLNSPPIDRP